MLLQSFSFQIHSCYYCFWIGSYICSFFIDSFGSWQLCLYVVTIGCISFLSSHLSSQVHSICELILSISIFGSMNFLFIIYINSFCEVVIYFSSLVHFVLLLLFVSTPWVHLVYALLAHNPWTQFRFFHVFFHIQVPWLSRNSKLTMPLCLVNDSNMFLRSYSSYNGPKSPLSGARSPKLIIKTLMHPLSKVHQSCNVRPWFKIH